MQAPDLHPRTLELPDKPRVKLVYKRSLYEVYVEEHDDQHIRTLIDDEHRSVSTLVTAHERHTRGLDTIVEVFQKANVSLETLYRGDIVGDTIEDVDLVVVAGGDGTLLDASHYVRDIPVVGVNTDPTTSVGFLALTVAADTPDVVPKLLDGQIEMRALNRLALALNGERVGPPALNDVLFSHTCPAATSKYVLDVDGDEEKHQSSGIWISTAAGSTAAIRSAGGSVMALDDNRLQYRVREPYLPPGKSYRRTEGFVDVGKQLKICARIRTAAVYLDGPYINFPLTFGDTVSMGRSEHPLWLVRGPGRRELA